MGPLGHLVIISMPHCFEKNKPASFRKIQYVDRVVHGCLCLVGMGQLLVGFDSGRLVGRTG